MVMIYIVVWQVAETRTTNVTSRFGCLISDYLSNIKLIIMVINMCVQYMHINSDLP